MKNLRPISNALLAVWITIGAPASEPATAKPHWAFEPVRRITPPADTEGWSMNATDRFVAAKLREQGLKPVGVADKRTLVRRAYFDLIGLPPSPEQVDAFVTDRSLNAYPKLIDQLLASPHYGERWGRHWMDVVRYADTAGDNADYPVPEIQRYRDYIIDAFNTDKPYDQFVREQLAGDILAKQGPPDQYAERVVATGFIALSRRYATAPFELWHLTVEDTIETMGRAFMGLTLRCARCHDHKYDPVTKDDYYGLYGFFESTQYPYAGSEELLTKTFARSGFVPLASSPDMEARIKAHKQEVEKLQTEIKKVEQDDPLAKRIADLKTQIDAKTKEVQDLESRSQSVGEAKAQLASLQQQRDQTNKQLQEKLKPLRTEFNKLQRPGLPPRIPMAYAVCDGKPVESALQVRGNPEDKGPTIKRRPPEFLARGFAFDIPQGSSGRLELAQWLTSPGNPLTARVMVNRIWQHHFGKGLVGTPSNFGLRGDEPTHPELLDYLADRFIKSGWSIKSMHRLMMTSRTYQLVSSHAEASATKDPANKWYWRFDRRRLDAESLRDAMLAVAGNLDFRQAGPHPFPPIETWTFTQHNPFKAVYETNHRSVYLMTQRIIRHPYLALFDGPDPNMTSDVRTESTVAPQALFMMNHKFVQDQAAAFAKRLMAISSSEEVRIELACQLAWSRPARSEDFQRGTSFIHHYQRELAQLGTDRESCDLEAWTGYARVVFSANEFIYLD